MQRLSHGARRVSALLAPACLAFNHLDDLYTKFRPRLVREGASRWALPAPLCTITSHISSRNKIERKRHLVWMPFFFPISYLLAIRLQPSMVVIERRNDERLQPWAKTTTREKQLAFLLLLKYFPLVHWQTVSVLVHGQIRGNSLFRFIFIYRKRTGTRWTSDDSSFDPSFFILLCRECFLIVFWDGLLPFGYQMNATIHSIHLFRPWRTRPDGILFASEK